MSEDVLFFFRHLWVSRDVWGCLFMLVIISALQVRTQKGRLPIEMISKRSQDWYALEICMLFDFTRNVWHNKMSHNKSASRSSAVTVVSASGIRLSASRSSAVTVVRALRIRSALEDPSHVGSNLAQAIEDGNITMCNCFICLCHWLTHFLCLLL